MSAVLASPATSPATDDLADVRALIRQVLTPQVVDIDQKAQYPQAFLQALGLAGGYLGAVEPAWGGNGQGLPHVLRVMEEVAKECMSTAFLVWCQTACARYIQLSTNEAVKQAYLPRIARGELLAGTGLSNTIKSCDTIEDAHFSDRGRLFQADRGRRFRAIVDARGMRASEVINVSQSSTISLNRGVGERLSMRPQGGPWGS